MTPLGILAAISTNTRRNLDPKSFQEIFDPEKLIRKAKKLQRSVIPQLDITLSLPIDGVVSINDISKHCVKDFELVFPWTMFESSFPK